MTNKAAPVQQAASKQARCSPDLALLLKNGHKLMVHSAVLKLASPAVLSQALSLLPENEDECPRLNLPEDCAQAWSHLIQLISPDLPPVPLEDFNLARAHAVLPLAHKYGMQRPIVCYAQHVASTLLGRMTIAQAVAWLDLFCRVATTPSPDDTPVVRALLKTFDALYPSTVGPDAEALVQFVDMLVAQGSCQQHGLAHTEQPDREPLQQTHIKEEGGGVGAAAQLPQLLGPLHPFAATQLLAVVLRKQRALMESASSRARQAAEEAQAALKDREEAIKDKAQLQVERDQLLKRVKELQQQHANSVQAPTGQQAKPYLFTFGTAVPAQASVTQVGAAPQAATATASGVPFTFGAVPAGLVGGAKVTAFGGPGSFGGTASFGSSAATAAPSFGSAAPNASLYSFPFGACA